MSAPKTPLLATITPFFVAGITIALMIGLLVLFSYLLFWGLMIGLVLWLVMTIKNKLFPTKKRPTVSKEQGRTIEHDDI